MSIHMWLMCISHGSWHGVIKFDVVFILWCFVHIGDGVRSYLTDWVTWDVHMERTPNWVSCDLHVLNIITCILCVRIHVHACYTVWHACTCRCTCTCVHDRTLCNAIHSFLFVEIVCTSTDNMMWSGFQSMRIDPIEYVYRWIVDAVCVNGLHELMCCRVFCALIKGSCVHVYVVLSRKFLRKEGEGKQRLNFWGRGSKHSIYTYKCYGSAKGDSRSLAPLP